MDLKRKYKYFAFISFQSSDAKEAARLQHAIENYRLPAVLCRENAAIPKRIKPLYCYLNDMHSGEELMQELKKRMEQSRYLIVVCSPNATNSTYINSGIDYFVSLGRRDSIIPIIVDGVPYSNDPDTECFPEALRKHFPKHTDPLQDHSILGVNTREFGIGSRRKAYNRAMLMVVARMLQLDYDGLLLRDQQRRRKRRIVTTMLSLLVAMALCLTWWLSQTVDVSIRIEETTPHNSALPECRNITLNLFLNNEQKNDTIPTLEQVSQLRNIPPRFIGKNARITASAQGFVPIDTSLILQKQLTLPLRRDEALYGSVRFHLVGLAHPEQAILYIAQYPVSSNADGLVELHIPIDKQQTKYPVSINNQMDTIYMPCGEDAVIVVE